MRTLLNIVWVVLAGFWLWLGYALAGVVACLLIITIPWGIASFRIGRHALWPFGREVVEDPHAGSPSLLANIVWLVLFGWWIAVEHLVTAVALAVTIIGIPFAWANIKLIPLALMPYGKRIRHTR